MRKTPPLKITWKVFVNRKVFVNLIASSQKIRGCWFKMRIRRILNQPVLLLIERLRALGVLLKTPSLPRLIEKTSFTLFLALILGGSPAAILLQAGDPAPYGVKGGQPPQESSPNPQNPLPARAGGGAIVLRTLASPTAAGTPYFRYPVVAGSITSEYFDHESNPGLVTFYNGRHSSQGAGFYFSCSPSGMYDWVGCEDAVAGAGACSLNRQLWYDGHHGTDYEFSANWYTGSTCDLARFTGITAKIYAPAPGKVLMAGTDPNRPANGWHIRLMHDLNGNGNYNDDNFRSVYLHFTANALAVSPGQVVTEGQYLGLGGSTGYSSSPHLHFEVQRSSDNFQTNYWPVDPYGWEGSTKDPWPYLNTNLWKQPVRPAHAYHLPFISNAYPNCPNCGQLLQNGDFESGQTAWSEQGGTLIRLLGDPALTAAPFSGNYLAWLGGQDSTTTVLNQDFTVPAGITGGILRYWILIQSSESGPAADYFYVRLRKLDGTVLQDVERLDNTFPYRDVWILREVPLINLTPYRGQTIRLNTKAVTNAANPSSFFIDDVALFGTAP